MAQDEPKMAAPAEKAKPDDEAQLRVAKASLARSRSSRAIAAPLVGPPIPRYDAREKVTGQAPYAGDIAPAAAVYAYAIAANVARGRITRMDVSDAKRVPGVMRIYDHLSMRGRIKPLPFFNFTPGAYSATSLIAMSGPDIGHSGQMIGLVVAESYEAAREAANRVRVDVRETRPTATFGDPGLTTRPLNALRPSWTDPVLGNEKSAFAAAPLKVEEAYATSPQHQNPMELYSTTCVWSGDRLTIHEPSAAVNMLKHGVAVQLGMAPDMIQVVSPYLGGMFGSKVTVTPRTAVIALAAKDLGRPVKCVTTRAQGFTNAMNRAETRHRVRLSCGTDGKLASYGHHGTELTSRIDMWAVNGTGTAALMYAWPAIDTKVWMAQADRNSTGFMRAPAEVPYAFALEVAMDELAEKAGIDPVAFRRTNDAQTSTFEPKAFTSRSLIQCMDRGAAAFGWDRRDPRPGSMRDGDWRIGYGMAMAYYPAGMMATAIRLRVEPEGRAVVQLSAHDVGTGTYTVLAAHAAQELGLEVGDVRVELGNTRLPPGAFVGGSTGTATYCNALAQACSNLRVRLGVAPGASVMSRMTGGGAVEEHLEWVPPGADAAKAISGNRVGFPGFAGGADGKKLRFAFGAQFVEVRVHDRTREIRVPRIVGTFAAGRIMNARTARSQLMGGLIWGISSALHEATEIDRRKAKYTNDNFAEYLIPVNADVPSVEVILVPEEDTEVNALGIKGVAELGGVGVDAAISNAVYHATGIRVRNLPIRIENLLPAAKANSVKA